jgi:hypothetical protein
MAQGEEKPTFRPLTDGDPWKTRLPASQVIPNFRLRVIQPEVIPCLNTYDVPIGRAI